MPGEPGMNPVDQLDQAPGERDAAGPALPAPAAGLGVPQVADGQQREAKAERRLTLDRERGDVAEDPQRADGRQDRARVERPGPGAVPEVLPQQHDAGDGHDQRSGERDPREELRDEQVAADDDQADGDPLTQGGTTQCVRETPRVALGAEGGGARRRGRPRVARAVTTGGGVRAGVGPGGGASAGAGTGSTVPGRVRAEVRGVGATSGAGAGGIRYGGGCRPQVGMGCGVDRCRRRVGTGAGAGSGVLSPRSGVSDLGCAGGVQLDSTSRRSRARRSSGVSAMGRSVWRPRPASSGARLDAPYQPCVLRWRAIAIAARARCDTRFFSSAVSLAHGAAAGRLGQRLEQRVIPEATLPAQRERDAPAERARSRHDPRRLAGRRGARVEVRQHAHVARAAARDGGRSPSSRSSLALFCGVRRIGSGVAARVDARPAAQRVHLHPRIVRERGQRRQSRVEARLDDRVAAERLGVLHRLVGDAQVIERDELHVRQVEQRPQLVELVARSGWRRGAVGRLGREGAARSIAPPYRLPLGAGGAAGPPRSTASAWSANSCAMPPSASSSSRSICVRWKGLPSAVPWTST